MTAPPIDSLLCILREAGALVMNLQDEIVRIPARRHAKPDGSFVTEADLQSHQLVVKRLRALTPHIPIVAEEQHGDVNRTILAAGGDFWLLDSLDNTSDYVTGGKNYSINLALADGQGHAHLGALIFPGLDELYFTGDDGLAYKQSGSEPAQCIHVAVLHGEQEGENAEANAVNVARHPSRPSQFDQYLGRPVNFITSRGQRRACLVATGEVVLCVENEGYYIWDTAPSAAILKAAGGDMFSMEDSGHLTFNKGLQLPSYVAAACREIADKMNLFASSLPADAAGVNRLRGGAVG